MATNLKTTLSLRLVGALTGAAGALSSAPASTVNHTINKTAQNGVAAGLADKIWAAERSLAGSATEDLDLAGGGLADPLGVTITAFVKVKAILIEADAGNTNDVLVKPTA